MRPGGEAHSTEHRWEGITVQTFKLQASRPTSANDLSMPTRDPSHAIGTPWAERLQGCKERTICDEISFGPYETQKLPNMKKSGPG